MFRDRTNLFLSYRRTFPHTASFGRSKGAKDDPFMGNNEDEEAFPMVDMNNDLVSDSLPPAFYDMAQDIDDYLSEIQNLMKQLSKLYQKNSLPGFEDKSHDEREIEDVSYQVIQLFQKSYNVIKKLQHVFDSQVFEGKQLQRGDLIILDNLRKRYAQKIQLESNKFRVLQNKYLKFLNKDDSKPIFPKTDDSSQLLLEEEEEEEGPARTGQDIEAYSRQTLRRQVDPGQQANQAFLRERDEEIRQLAKGVLEVSTIFREMQNLIIDQGTVVDRIDYNLENTVIQLRDANRELTKATHYQKRTQKCKVILLLSLCVVALFFFVMLKPHSQGQKVVSAPKSSEQESSTADPLKVSNDDLQRRLLNMLIK